MRHEYRRAAWFTLPGAPRPRRRQITAALVCHVCAAHMAPQVALRDVFEPLVELWLCPVCARARWSLEDSPA